MAERRWFEFIEWEPDPWLESFDTGPMYVSREGVEIDMPTWAALMEFGDAKRGMTSYRFVRKTRIEGAALEVSTVWIGINSNVFGPPLVFESMVFTFHEPVTKSAMGHPYTRDRTGGYMERYSTEEQALEGHRRIVRALRAGKPLDTPAELLERG